MRCRHVKLVKADGKVLAALGCSKLIGGPAPAQRGHDGQRIRKRLAGAGGRADAQVVRGAAAAGGLAPCRSLHWEEFCVAACKTAKSSLCMFGHTVKAEADAQGVQAFPNLTPLQVEFGARQASAQEQAARLLAMAGAQACSPASRRASKPLTLSKATPVRGSMFMGSRIHGSTGAPLPALAFF